MSRRVALVSAAILGWWTFHGVASATQYHLYRGAIGTPITWGYALTTSLASAYLWIPITLAALWLTWNLPLESGRWGSRLPVHLAVALGVPVFRSAAVMVLNRWVMWYPELPPFATVLVSNAANNAFFYLMLLGAAHALLYARRTRQREQVADRLRADLSQAQLQAIRAQLQPHFLFNTLNTISSMVQQDPVGAEQLIARLSDLLRQTLDRSGVEEVQLRDELAFVETYLEIERARYEERLWVDWDIAADTLDARVPPLLLQPLVENAVRHGVATRSSPGTVSIASRRVNGSLHLSVSDDGPGLPGGGGRRGLGVSGTAERLRGMYGPEHRFELFTPASGGARAEISIPYQAADG